MIKNNCELCQAQHENYRLIKKTNNSFCIINVEPLVQGHLMILPKKHTASFEELDKEQLADLMKLTEEIKDLLKQKYKKYPLILLNTGKHKTQEHIHIHIWPSKGGLRDLVSKYEKVPKRKKITKQELKRMKEKIIDK